MANAEAVEAMWDAAEALCENSTQLKRIRISRLSWTYMYLDALHTTKYESSNAAFKANYEKMATDFYNEFSKYGLRWNENESNPNFNETKSPANW